jgi:hypothetical protein
MSGINTTKVVAGGLLAGVVFNIIDFLINGFLMVKDFAANAARLGLDAASQNTPDVITTFVIVDFILGLTVVYIYAAIRPRFGPGVKTALIAGVLLWIAPTAVILGFAKIGMLTMGIWGKMLIPTLINACAGSVAGAWAYKEVA